MNDMNSGYVMRAPVAILDIPLVVGRQSSAHTFRKDEVTRMASLETLEPLISPSDSLSDNELVQAAAAGDEHAFEAIFERHRKLVARLAGRFFHQRDEVEEIIQISFAEAYFALKAFQGARENSFVHWLSRITVNTCYDALRRAQRRPELTFSNLTEEQTEWLQR
jgi:hypothetical protein